MRNRVKKIISFFVFAIMLVSCANVRHVFVQTFCKSCGETKLLSISYFRLERLMKLHGDTIMYYAKSDETSMDVDTVFLLSRDQRIKVDSLFKMVKREDFGDYVASPFIYDHTRFWLLKWDGYYFDESHVFSKKYTTIQCFWDINVYLRDNGLPMFRDRNEYKGMYGSISR